MKENTPQEQPHKPIIQGDEIDLLQLIAYLVRVVRQSLMALLVFSILGIIGNYAYLILVPPIYKLRMVANSSFTDDKEIRAIFMQLNNLAQEQNYTVLAQKFQIPTNEAQSLKGFNAYSITGEDVNPNLPERKDSVFVLEVMTTSNSIVESLNKTIPRYLCQNKFINQKYRISRQADSLLLHKLGYEIAQADTLKRQVNKLIAENKTNLLSVQVGEVYEQSIKARNLEALLKKRLASEAVNVIESFSPSNQAINQKTKVILPVSVAIVLALWITFMVVREIATSLKSRQ